MKKLFLLLSVVLITASCTQKITPEDMEFLNGYWEIEQVVFADGNHKDYKVNETIDFFKINGEKGIRQKVKPQFDGSFIDGPSEDIRIEHLNDQVFIHYKTDFSEWKEHIIELNDNDFIVENEKKIQYKYKRHVPFSVK
ncbi:lipocalin family protein [Flavobacterium ardleyense]|uniref:lipocalin family protein n=1 Tax=Flavobacterium ardleyense TaxID=2038737 RepID=UPI00298C8177|nr:lipocalin family protein [Flavobacterium ardleyense]